MACHRNQDKPVRPVTGLTGVAYGDCAEARKRAAEQPDLEVDRLPAPRRQRPSALVPMPDSVKRLVDQKGAVIKIDVLVDTLGRADMKTVKVVEVSHPW